MEGRCSTERTFTDVLHSPRMHLMRSVYEVPLSLKYEKMEKRQECDVFPCKKKTCYRLVHFASIDFYLNNGAGGSGVKMYMCYDCYQKHKQLVFEARKLKKQYVIYKFENWTEVK
jgi:Zn-finger protein